MHGLRCSASDYMLVHFEISLKVNVQQIISFEESHFNITQLELREALKVMEHCNKSTCYLFSKPVVDSVRPSPVVGLVLLHLLTLVHVPLLKLLLGFFLPLGLGRLGCRVLSGSEKRALSERQRKDCAMSRGNCRALAIKYMLTSGSILSTLNHLRLTQSFEACLLLLPPLP